MSLIAIVCRMETRKMIVIQAAQELAHLDHTASLCRPTFGSTASIVSQVMLRDRSSFPSASTSLGSSCCGSPAHLTSESSHANHRSCAHRQNSRNLPPAVH